MDSGNTADAGGISVQPDNHVRLYGKLHRSFIISELVPVNKFTSFKFGFTEREKVRGFGICLSWSFDVFLVNRVKYCLHLNGGILEHLVSNDSSETIRTLNIEGNAVNLAFKKPTKQSSTVAPGEASNAVDGNTHQYLSYDAWEYSTVTITDASIRPWWEVDLQETMTIRRIVIYKRADIYDDDLKDFVLSVYDSSGNLTAFEHTPGSTEAVTDFTFDDVLGQRIRISLNGVTTRVLSLAEVQVFGTVFTFDVPLGRMFNLPPTNFNRIEMIQDRDGGSSDNVGKEESSVITGLSFTENMVKSRKVRPPSFIFKIHAHRHVLMKKTLPSCAARKMDSYARYRTLECTR